MEEIASGLRHAAANFSAFTYYKQQNDEKNPEVIVDEFISFLNHYLERHGSQKKPAEGLGQLIEQAKNEI